MSYERPYAGFDLGFQAVFGYFVSILKKVMQSGDWDVGTMGGSMIVPSSQL
jgi:hypothetical protein